MPIWDEDRSEKLDLVDTNEANRPRYIYEKSPSQAELESMGLKFAPVTEHEKRTRAYAEPLSVRRVPPVEPEPCPVCNQYPCRRAHMGENGKCHTDCSLCELEKQKAEELREQARLAEEARLAALANASSSKPPLMVVLKKPSWIQRAIDWLFSRA